jgi:Tfp pilus assembly protein PilO
MRMMELNMMGEPKKGKQRKFSLVWLGLVALAAIIVVNVIIWRSYSDKQAQAGVLEVQAQDVQQQISQVLAPPEDLEARLTEAQSELAEALLVFPAKIDMNDVVDFILTTAEACQVELVPLVAEGGGTGESYYELRYSGTVSGSLSQVSNFMTKLHTDKYATMVITECSVQRVAIPDVNRSESDIDVTVNFSVALYVSSIKGK